MALPTLSAAGGYKLLKHWDELKQGDELMNIGIGNVISFITAYFAVKYFIGYIQKKGFAFFGYYRIAVGSLFLVYWLILK